MKDTIYAWLNDLRRTPPSEWFNGHSITLFTELGAFTAKRVDSNLILYPPDDFSRGDGPSKYLIFATLPIDFGNKWVKPAYFDEKNYRGRADNWNQWWNYYFGKVNSDD